MREDNAGGLIMQQADRYCVKFIRCDGAVPDIENYYYWNREDAETHFNMFKENDPDFPKMYSRIQLISEYGNLSTVSDEIRF